MNQPAQLDMFSQLDVFSLPDAPGAGLSPALLPTLPAPAVSSVQPSPAGREAPGYHPGYVKTYQGSVPTTGPPPPIFTLNCIPNDGHGYEAVLFALAASVTVEVYPVSKCLGLRVAGEKELISLHDAVGRKLARKVEAEN